MSAAVQIVLDTTPPEVTLGHIAPVQPAHTLDVPVTLNEPAILTGYLVDSDGNSYPMTHDGDSMLFEMNKYFSSGHADVNVTATDDVGNSRDVNIGLQVNNDRFPLYIVVEQEDRWLELDPPAGMIVIENNQGYVDVDSDYDDVVVP